jgi:hypothetical protein
MEVVGGSGTTGCDRLVLRVSTSAQGEPFSMIRRAIAHQSVGRWWRILVIASAAVVSVLLSACGTPVAPHRDEPVPSSRADSPIDPPVSSGRPSASSAELSDEFDPPEAAPSETLLPSPSAPADATPPPGRSGEAPQPSDDAAAPPPTDGSEADLEVSTITAEDEATLRRYATDTWTSMSAMVDAATGLVADHIGATLDDPSTYTSPTNLAGYLWSTVTVRDLGIISADEARTRLDAALTGLARLERHAASGMFYNWYSPQSGEKLTAWPGGHEPIEPFVSSVDNGWLAAALRIVAAAEPSLEAKAAGVSDSMDFAWFLDSSAMGGAGLNRVGFWPDRPSRECSEKADGADKASDVYVTCSTYGTAVSEARIATYMGIANGQLPTSSYFAPSRTGAANGSGTGWMRTTSGDRRQYEGVSVLESTYDYNGMRIVPSWGGSMFEALMPDLLVPEAEWGPDSWGVNHPATVAAQKRHGLEDTATGYWGFSPSADPEGGYGQYGISALSIQSTAVSSDPRSRDGASNAVDLPASSRSRPDTDELDGPSDSVVTPHASFLALPYDARGALDNLERLHADLGMYGTGGFYDAVEVASGRVACTYLSLDQSMVLAAIGNALSGDALKSYLASGGFEERIRPLVAQQVFGSTIG